MRGNFFLQKSTCAGLVLLAVAAALWAQSLPRRVQHVLIVSADGLHAVDLARYIQTKPDSVLAQMSRHASIYTSAATPLPNSTPGMMAFLTGGTPNATGMIYSESYDRTLSPPNSDCSTRGTQVVYNEGVSIDPDAEDSGGGVDPKKLPRDPAHGCAMVYPHQWLRVNTVFELVKKSGGTTTWIDQFPGFCDYVKGPSGTGLDDEFAPNSHTPGIKNSIESTIQQDDKRMKALLNNIAGKDHTGTRQIGIPKLMGVTLITVNVAQKITGYQDTDARPTAGVTQGMDYLDAQMGRIAAALKQSNIDGSTMIVLTAKHGNSPIDVTRRKIYSEPEFCSLADQLQKGLTAQCVVDTVGLIWLKDQSRTAEVAAKLRENQDRFGIHKIYWGETLKLRWNDPKQDPRMPDLIVQPLLGVMWGNPQSPKLAEHGGFFDEDTNVALMVSWPGGRGETFRAPVSTTQVAPTILEALGIDWHELKAVQQEDTTPLPGFVARGGGAPARTAMVEWVGPALPANKPQTDAEAEEGRKNGRALPAPEILQPLLDDALPAYEPRKAAIAGHFKAAASDVLPGLVKLWIQAFQKYYPKFQLDLEPPYAGSLGAKELVKGTLDMVFVSRELRPDDITDFRGKFGYDPLSVPISGGSYRHFGFLDAVGFFVHKDNPIESITFDQLDAILSSTRHRSGAPIVKWGQLGLAGDWADQPIHVYGVQPWNGFEEFVRQRVLSIPGLRGEWRDAITYDKVVFPIAGRVAQDRLGIGYAGLAYVDAGVKLIALAPERSRPAYPPTYENVARAVYPLSRLIYLNINKTPGKPLDPALDEFLRFILSRQGQQAILQQKIFVPLRAQQAASSRALLGS
jgi:phosphate transport system substrate-binding protein